MPAPIPTSPDPAVAAFLRAYVVPAMAEYVDAMVAIQRDVNASGLTTDRHAGIMPNWQPTPVYNLACHLVAKGQGTVEIDRQTVAVQNWRILFVAELSVDIGCRFVWLDPDQVMKPRYLYVRSNSVNPVLANVYWAVDCYERMTAAPNT